MTTTLRWIWISANYELPTSNEISLNIDQQLITGSNSVKLLGITIDNKLSFDEHISKLCKKASLKLPALSRVSSYLITDKLKVILKAFIESQFGYCPLIWMFHSRALNHRINRIHERALKLVYKNPTLTFEELLVKDNSFTIHDRNLQRLATEMYKIINENSPSIMKEIFPMSSNPYDFNVNSVHNGTGKLAYRGPKTWAMVPTEIKQLKPLDKFISKI